MSIQTPDSILDGVKTGTVCGSPEYIAPEMILGNDYDKAADFWSFGVLIYEMLWGLPPFFNKDQRIMLINTVEVFCFGCD